MFGKDELYKETVLISIVLYLEYAALGGKILGIGAGRTIEEIFLSQLVFLVCICLGKGREMSIYSRRCADSTLL